MNKFSVIILFLLPLQSYAQYHFRDSTINLPASAISGNTMDVRIADFNGDGFPDIVLAKEFQQNRMLLNNGTGKFTDGTSGRFTNVNRDSEDIAIADYDGNGWPDVVFAAEDDLTHEMYLNTGSGNFTDVSTRLPKFISNAVVTMDVNGDSFPDLIFGNEGQNKIFVNDGTGVFTDETANRLPAEDDVTQDLLLVDIDNDGDMDIAAGNEDGNTLLINNGDGIFTDETQVRLPQGIIMETRKVSSADVNGDGFADLFYCNMTSGPDKDLRDRLYLNDGTGKFVDVTDTHLPFEELLTFDAVFTDLNDDNAPDLIIGYFSNLAPAVFINDGNGIFSDQSEQYLPPSAKGNNIAIFVEDLNGDGRKDLYLGRFQQSDKMFFFADQVNSITKNTPFQSNICISPNPSTGTFDLIITEAAKEEYHLNIFDIAGQKVYSKFINGMTDQYTINLEDRPGGVYFLNVTNGLRSEKKKILIQN